MSIRHASLAHVPQSLPSFAQAFSSHSLSSLSPPSNALPPIQSQMSSVDHDSARPAIGRKRSHDNVASSPPPSHDSPPIKDEHEHEHEHDNIISVDNASFDPDASSASSLPSPLKKRRVTVSGAPPPLNTCIRLPSDQTGSNPISPVVTGFPIKRDNPSQVDQVRSNIPAKQKQKPLIDQHRASYVTPPPNTLINTASTSTTTTTTTTTSDDRLSTSSKNSAAAPPRSVRRSPNTAPAIRRPGTNMASPGTRPPSPTPMIGSPQQPLSIAARTSFARRRASQLGSGKKPADLFISPRDSHTINQRPLIQSAPPVPDGGQGAFYADRLPIALPRLPSVLNSSDHVRRVTSNVPPTPTRLSMQQRQQAPIIQGPSHGISGRSPSNATIPIATTLVPPTPSSLHHPGYTGDKAAFLAPFEMFYDALNDSKELKKWLSEQLQRSNSLIQSLAQQQEKIHDVVETLVERKVAGMQLEISGLQRRVEELEDALRQTTLNRSDGGWERHHRNGSAEYPQITSVERTKADSARMGSSRDQERDLREGQKVTETETGSPVAFSARTLSMNTTTSESSYTRNNSLNVPPPSQSYRDSPNHHLPPPPNVHGKPSRGLHGERSVAGRSPKLAHLAGNTERGTSSPHAS
ncbi:hypothetical protein AX15_000086 [Amanita polypyramis BW_CC]|nr:hypothetical protein AX15_000086 [Amanita polypyramis BW_CC]